MRKTKRLTTDRNLRRKEWKLYAGDLCEFFGHSFHIGDQHYRIEGWLERNPVCKIYAIREWDDEPFVMSVGEVHMDTQYFQHPPRRGRRR
jgi:hypothetical protein